MSLSISTVKRCGFLPNMYTFLAVLKLCYKFMGNGEGRVFDEMLVRDVVSWTNIISGCFEGKTEFECGEGNSWSRFGKEMKDKGNVDGDEGEASAGGFGVVWR
ncbi:hypothetical protein GH714_009035 [Hevea brasiliensis]|uniref:Pentatricopeptide repeat-containing protein n=1 Tax=Hevea brasiliensis TaxID=3981 RepID=A0A6A6KI53_HEVBR|nr:hypothetical protein GH714_009035 [Hevea brasiliensis]